jgi:hypothetical protein
MELNKRHIAQIIRSKMTQKVKLSKKVYTRKDEPKRIWEMDTDPE